MKQYKINGEIVKAKSLTDAIRSVKDSDRLKQLAYKFAEMGSYFDRANSASSREILSKNDESKMFDYYKLALEIKNQLQKEIPMMKNEHYLGSWESGNETVKLLTDGISRFYWTASESNSHISNKAYTLAKELDNLLKKYKDEKRKYSKDSVKDDNVIYQVCQLNKPTEYFETKEQMLRRFPGTDNGSVIKLKGFFGPFNNGTKNGKTVYRYETPELYRDLSMDSVEDDEEDDLFYLSKEEEQAIDDYKKAIANTKDPSMLRLFSHILKEEIEHLEELSAAKEGEFEDSVEDAGISETTKNLWYKVNEKYGDHVYNLGTNGLGEVVLSKGYGKDIARGEKAVQETLKKLLNSVKDDVEGNLSSATMRTPRGTFKTYNGDYRKFRKEPDFEDWGLWFEHFDEENHYYRIMHNARTNHAVAVYVR